MALAVSMAACAKTDNSENNIKRDDSSSKKEKKEAKIYVDEDGLYYYDDSSNVMRIAAYSEEGDGGVADDDQPAEDIPEPIRGTYDLDGLKFEIPEGYYVDTSYDIPVIYSDDESLMDENIAIMSLEAYNGQEYDDISIDTIKAEFESYKTLGSIADYELEELKALPQVDGKDTKGFKVKIVAYAGDSSSGEESIEYYSEMVFINSEQSYAVLLNASSSEESISRVEKLRDNIFTTLTFTSDPDQSEE